MMTLEFPVVFGAVFDVRLELEPWQVVAGYFCCKAVGAAWAWGVTNFLRNTRLASFPQIVYKKKAKGAAAAGGSKGAAKALAAAGDGAEEVMEVSEHDKSKVE